MSALGILPRVDLKQFLEKALHHHARDPRKSIDAWSRELDAVRGIRKLQIGLTKAQPCADELARHQMPLRVCFL